MAWRHDEGHLALAVGLDVLVGVGHGAEERAAEAVVHLRHGVAGRRVLELVELGLDVRPGEAPAVPLVRLVHHDLGGPQPVAQGALGRAVRVGERPAVGEHPVDEVLAGGAVGRGRRRCRPRCSPGRRRSRPAACRSWCSTELLPGLPMPCMVTRAIMARGHSSPVAAAAAPPSPARPPAASMVFLEPHSRASARMSRASTPDSASAHSGVFGWPSVLPRT